ncbi:pyrroline-5-carboxylate reductase family protein, partial [Aspergillus glaucus CBS 516.65]
QLTIIGCSTLGRSIVDGLLLSLSPQPSNYRLSLTTRNPQQLSGLQRDYPSALVTADNQDPRIWQGPDSSQVHIVVIGTQPQYTIAVCRDICEACVSFQLGPRPPVVVIVCPGITVSRLEQKLPGKTPIVRSMPNTLVAVRQGATAVF